MDVHPDQYAQATTTAMTLHDRIESKVSLSKRLQRYRLFQTSTTPTALYTPYQLANRSSPTKNPLLSPKPSAPTQPLKSKTSTFSWDPLLHSPTHLFGPRKSPLSTTSSTSNISPNTTIPSTPIPQTVDVPETTKKRKSALRNPFTFRLTTKKKKDHSHETIASRRKTSLHEFISRHISQFSQSQPRKNDGRSSEPEAAHPGTLLPFCNPAADYKPNSPSPPVARELSSAGNRILPLSSNPSSSGSGSRSSSSPSSSITPPTEMYTVTFDWGSDYSSSSSSSSSSTPSLYDAHDSGVGFEYHGFLQHQHSTSASASVSPSPSQPRYGIGSEGQGMSLHDRATQERPIAENQVFENVDYKAKKLARRTSSLRERERALREGSSTSFPMHSVSFISPSSTTPTATPMLISDIGADGRDSSTEEPLKDVWRSLNEREEGFEKRREGGLWSV